MTSSLGLVGENKLRHLSKDLNVRTEAAMQKKRKKFRRKSISGGANSSDKGPRAEKSLASLGNCQSRLDTDGKRKEQDRSEKREAGGQFALYPKCDGKFVTLTKFLPVSGPQSPICRLEPGERNLGRSC